MSNSQRCQLCSTQPIKLRIIAIIVRHRHSRATHSTDRLRKWSKWINPSWIAFCRNNSEREKASMPLLAMANSESESTPSMANNRSSQRNSFPSSHEQVSHLIVVWYGQTYTCQFLYCTHAICCHICPYIYIFFLYFIFGSYYHVSNACVHYHSLHNTILVYPWMHSNRQRQLEETNEFIWLLLQLIVYLENSDGQ